MRLRPKPCQKARLLFFRLDRNALYPGARLGAGDTHHLRNSRTFAGNAPQWDDEAGPIWTFYDHSNDNCVEEVDREVYLTYTARNITWRRGHNQPCDNDNGGVREFRMSPFEYRTLPMYRSAARLALLRDRQAFVSKFIGEAEDE